MIRLLKISHKKHLAGPCGSTETAVVNHMPFERFLLINKQKECCDDLQDAPKIKATVKLEINTPKDTGHRNLLQRSIVWNTQTDSHAILRR